ncbi:glucosidase family protein [Arenibacter echinorum]|uniref:Uncharacterized protein n=1 Tax=Arenibacter echinorum TaxID=440515 RepID=A0A327QWQ7_9FLAO|nr:hypothetical protein [Arenibacter echinorum]RAJ08042.1 hypothetical protein LV92_03605 [Arenibacter echinorum]
MKQTVLSLLLLATLSFGHGQSKTISKDAILSDEDFKYLEILTETIIDSSRIYPGERVADQMGNNNTGGILVKPGGRGSYPAFWIRDYVMSLDPGFISREEQKHMLLLTASTQADRTWLTKNGAIVPLGAIADHIRMDDGLPIYFPGTYSFEEQGTPEFGRTPPYGDQFFFVSMAFYYIKTTAEISILEHEINGMSLRDRLEIAFNVPPSRLDNYIVTTTDHFRGIDFGFRDVMTITGDLCYPSILKFKAALELSELFEKLNNQEKADKYQLIARKIKEAIPQLFMDERGMLKASTGKGNQADVWSTALAIYFNILNKENTERTSRFLSKAYENGHLSYKGNIRHILTTDDFSDSTAWEYSLAKKNTYQNGAYWGTPTGWVCYAIAKTNFEIAQRLAKEYIDDLRQNDFRKGPEYGAPYECFHHSGHKQNPLYMTTVSCPLAAFRSIEKP